MGLQRKETPCPEPLLCSHLWLSCRGRILNNVRTSRRSRDRRVLRFKHLHYILCLSGTPVYSTAFRIQTVFANEAIAKKFLKHVRRDLIDAIGVILDMGFGAIFPPEADVISIVVVYFLKGVIPFACDQPQYFRTCFRHSTPR